MGRFYFIKRKFRLVRLMLMGGRERADYFKKIHYFHEQGDGCYFQPYNFGTEPHLLSFGDNVCVATGVRFVNHDIVSFVFNYMDKSLDLPTKVKPIRDGNNVFIGSDSTILPGVTIGDNCVIGAGSVVTKDIPSGSVAVGVPCRVIGDFETFRSKYISETKSYTWKQDDPDKAQKQVDYFYKQE